MSSHFDKKQLCCYVFEEISSTSTFLQILTSTAVHKNTHKWFYHLNTPHKYGPQNGPHWNNYSSYIIMFLRQYKFAYTKSDAIYVDKIYISKGELLHTLFFPKIIGFHINTKLEDNKILIFMIQHQRVI